MSETIFKPGDAVVVDDPCILNGCPAVVIQDMGDGKAYVSALFAASGTVQQVRADVGVRERVKGDPWKVGLLAPQHS